MADTQIVKVVDQKSYSTSYLMGALLAGLVIGTLISLVWFKTGTTKPLTVTGKNGSVSSAPTTPSSVPSTTTSGSDSTTAETAQNSGGLLSINDQPAGVEVDVKQAQVGSDQWVVIREVKNGQPANVLGAARFIGGVTSGKVELLRTTVAGQMYYGMIYKDNGDQRFSMTDDKPVLDASGNPILVSFTAR